MVWNRRARSVFTHVKQSRSYLSDRHRPFPKKVSVTGGEAPRNGPHPLANFAASFSCALDPVQPLKRGAFNI